MSLKPFRVYVAGPMRGVAEFNFPLFCAVTHELRQRGWEVFNPAERDLKAGFNPTGMDGTDEEMRRHNFSLREALAADTDWICNNADAIYLLPGWEKSTGAIAERALAEALGLDIIYHPKQEIHVSRKIRDVLSEFISQRTARAAI